MTTANTNVIAKVAAVVAGLGLVAMSFAPVAQAQTSSADMQAQIASLLAQIEALKSSSTGDAMKGDAMMFKADLTIGSQGAEVTALQNWLIGKGFAISKPSLNGDVSPALNNLTVMPFSSTSKPFNSALSTVADLFINFFLSWNILKIINDTSCRFKHFACLFIALGV